MSYKTTDLNGTREYEVAEVKDVYRPNLLINGDFQCNQRGQADYNYNSNGKYGLDMWQNRQGNYFEAIHVRPKVEGVEIELNSNAGAGIRQIVQGVKNPMKKTFTACWEIDGVRSVGTVTLLRENEEFAFIDNGVYKVTLSLDSSSNQLRFAFWIHNSSGVSKNKIFKIKYIDLFEGDVAYPHVKEDYALALKRCQRYIQNITKLKPIMYKYSDKDILTKIEFAFKMASKPTLLKLSAKSYAYNNPVMESSSYSVTGSDEKEVNIDFIFPSNLRNGTTGVTVYALVSCEPL